ncbi:hypothetical protein T11_11590 [Trichinella zimbabwensis]|uniref:Uncharacterized protein n=1 Tax=Trichinella zimbabwensis TaxID=268475 RepID=A0A0V1HBY9_9BILA|nr:hypothetical protein T11_11590 [Trichinella zimbabwensis]
MYAVDLQVQCKVVSAYEGEGKEGAANARLVYGSTDPAIPEAWQLVQTCLEVQNVRFHASTVQHSVRITQNLSKYVMHEATIVTMFFR